MPQACSIGVLPWIFVLLSSTIPKVCSVKQCYCPAQLKLGSGLATNGAWINTTDLEQLLCPPSRGTNSTALLASLPFGGRFEDKIKVLCVEEKKGKKHA